MQIECVLLICSDSYKCYQIIQFLEALRKLILILWREENLYLYTKG